MWFLHFLLADEAMPDRRQFMGASISMGLLALLLADPAWADGDGGDGGGGGSASSGSGASGGNGESPAGSDDVERDQIEMREAQEALSHRAAVPLELAMGHALALVPGEVLNASLYTRRNKALAYHIVVLSRRGRYVDVYIDAASNSLIARSSR